METGSIVYRSSLHGQEAELHLVDAPTQTYQLRVDGILQSEVCLADPTVIGFAYARHVARFVDAMAVEAAEAGAAGVGDGPAGGGATAGGSAGNGPGAGAGAGMTVAHLGGGALTLARYVADRWPGAVQYVVESESERTTDLLGILPLPNGADVRFLFGDARAVVDGGMAGAGHRAPSGESADAGAGAEVSGSARGTQLAQPPWREATVTIVDLWAGATIAARVASLEFYAGIAGGMARGGGLAVNLLDGPGFAWSRRQAATLRLLFEHVVVVMDERMLHDDLIGNVLVFASDRALDEIGEPGWPHDPTSATHVLHGARLTDWIGDASATSDADATDSPPPDAGYFAPFAKHAGGLVGNTGERGRSHERTDDRRGIHQGEGLDDLRREAV
ncbi:hypothetical protein C5B96_07485 [Subtercola sp. Z020]|uniref:hypothetical protein n=1 Tax=Subtercola sp. Z020 TaxID=2080582 RepID=UPI000CE7B70D|nr:hypothetical protein [Subtercola sp. Z020]PPF84172.1 hypothetical protein C5B96_07485 [Subtercola sp. Z020]